MSCSPHSCVALRCLALPRTESQSLMQTCMSYLASAGLQVAPVTLGDQ
jgi:hypothetical protein